MSWFSGRFTRWWLHSVESVRWSPVGKSGSWLNPCFQQVRARPSSSLRTCQQQVLPLKKATLPPLADERLQVVAHRGRPVLVVADAQDELVVVEELGVELQVAVGAVVERVTLPLGPRDERQLPLCGTGPRAAGRRRRGALGGCPDRGRRRGCSRPSCCRRCRCWCRAGSRIDAPAPGLAGRTMKKRSTSAVRRLRPMNFPPPSATRSLTL